MSFRIDNFEDSLLNGLINYKVPYPIFTAGTAGAQSGSQYTDYSSVPLYPTATSTDHIGSASFINNVISLNGSSVYGSVTSSSKYQVGSFSITTGGTTPYIYTFQYQMNVFQLTDTVFDGSDIASYQITLASKNPITSANPVAIGNPVCYIPTNTNPIIGTITVDYTNNARKVTVQVNDTEFFSNTIPTVYYQKTDFSIYGSSQAQGLTNGYRYLGN